VIGLSSDVFIEFAELCWYDHVCHRWLFCLFTENKYFKKCAYIYSL